MRTAAVLACGICRHQLYVLVLSWMAVLRHRFYNYLLIPVDVDLRGRTASLAAARMGPCAAHASRATVPTRCVNFTDPPH